MTEQEIRLRCLELALAQLTQERRNNDRNAVANLQTWFYNRTKPEAPAAEDGNPKPARRGKATDKQPEIFE